MIRLKRLDIPFQTPRELMAQFLAWNQGQWVLLESAEQTRQSQANWSYVAGPVIATLETDANQVSNLKADQQERLKQDPWQVLQTTTQTTNHFEVPANCPKDLRFLGGWIGALAYEMPVEKAAVHQAQGLLQHWAAVDQVFAFDHSQQTWWHITVEADFVPGQIQDLDARRGIWCASLERAQAVSIPVPPEGTDMESESAGMQCKAQTTAIPSGIARICNAAVRSTDQSQVGIFRWNGYSLRAGDFEIAGPVSLSLDEAQFQQRVMDIKSRIARGDVLQVNLTRAESAKFSGDTWQAHCDWMTLQPACFSAYWTMDQGAFLGSSPEGFLSLRGDTVLARPMKGTLARQPNAEQDAAAREALAHSEKDRAENVMIVDLMRNDLGRIAVPGSVKVPALFAVEPNVNAWQMVSVVQAQLKEEVSRIDVIRACWPPGSMTGAPKHKAMEIIAELEPAPRGWYSGAFGYLSVTGDMELAVTIRSIMIDQSQIRFHTGGGIVADSNAKLEWDETQTKARRWHDFVLLKPRFSIRVWDAGGWL